MTDSKLASSRPAALEAQKRKLDDLCRWIDDHLDEHIGWQELLANGGGLDFQAINVLFFRHRSTTPMTWIRRRRQARADGPGQTVPALLMAKRTAD